MKKARLIIADDHPVVRQGLCEMIEPTSDLEVVATARDGAEAEHAARTVAAELMILDIAMPVRSGIQVLEALRRDAIELPVLFFSMYPAAQYLAHIRRAGAQGFVGKDGDARSILAAIRQVVDGHSCFPGQGRPRTDRTLRAAGTDALLSERENEVLQHLLRGTPLVAIAQALDITPQTVSTYRARILEKLGVGNNAELISLLALHRGR